MASRLLILLMPGLLLLSGSDDRESTHPLGTPAIEIDSKGAVSGAVSLHVTDGWEFHTEAPVTVTALGVFDSSRNGLGSAIPVGLWDEEGDLLARANVPAGTVASERDGFRYAAIDAVTLSAGQRYVIAAGYQPESGEGVVGGSTSTTFFSDGSIRWTGRRRIASKSGLTFPPAPLDSTQGGLNSGGFGPNFLIDEPNIPRIYHRAYRVANPNDYVLIRVPENPDGSHRRDPVISVSLFARKSGQLTQILVNGEAIGTGFQALNTVAARVPMMSRSIEDMTGVRPNLRIMAPSWVQYSDLASVVDACSGKVNARVRRTRPLRIEFSTYHDAAVPLVNADVSGRFIQKGECVEDTWTGLLWQQDGSAAGKLNYAQAQEYASNLRLNGIAGWRVPTIEELASIFPADDSPFVGTGYTPDECCQSSQEYNSFWTSERDWRAEDYAFLYHWYADGGSNNAYASRNFVKVRCVRDAVHEGPGSGGLTQAVFTSPSSTPRGNQAAREVQASERRAASGASRVSSRTRGDARKRPFVDYLRKNVIGRTIAGKVITGIDQGRLESQFARRTTFTRFRESANGFGFDEVIDIRETIRPIGKSLRDEIPVRHDNRRVILRHQYSVRKSTGEVVGYAREVSHNEGELSEAAVVKRSVVDLQDGELIIRTTTVGYDDHVTAAGPRPGAVQAQSKYTVHAGRLQRSQANENFVVNPRSLDRRPSRRETELMVEVEVD